MEIHEGSDYLASVLNRENKILSIGKARVRLAQHYVAFWPDPDPLIQGPNLLQNAAILNIREERSFAIKRIERCPSFGPRHYDCHFD